MSIKGIGQNITVRKSKITINEFLEKEKIFVYSDLRAIDYQFSEKSRYGFMRFKLTNGNIYTFSFKEKSNQSICRVVDYIKNEHTEIELKEFHENYGAKERFELISTKKKILSYSIPFLIIFSSIIFSSGLLNQQNDPSTFITLDEYNECKTGMSYKECANIIGSSGEPLAESDIADSNVTAYIWYGDDYSGSNANLYFMNGKLYSKAQFGLK